MIWRPIGSPAAVSPAGTLTGRQVHEVGEHREHHRHAAVSLGAVDLGGHRALGRERRHARHRRDDQVDVVEDGRDVGDELPAGELDRGRPRQRLPAEVCPARRRERVELVEALLPQVRVDADERVDAFDARVDADVVVEADRPVDERRAGCRDECRGRPPRRARRPRDPRLRSRGPTTTRRDTPVRSVASAST